jgi:hypothetical protein
MAPTLSRRLPYAVHMHDALTRRFVGFNTRRVRFGPEPPPPKKAQVRATPREWPFCYPRRNPTTNPTDGRTTQAYHSGVASYGCGTRGMSQHITITVSN